MRVDAWPWARAQLTPEDRAEITAAEPVTGRCHLGADARGGVFRCTLSHIVPMTVQQGYGKTPIEAFRDALAKVPA
jgi:hypothetical protein